MKLENYGELNKKVITKREIQKEIQKENFIYMKFVVGLSCKSSPTHL